MKAGVLIFVSGFVSAFLAAFIVSRSDAWYGLATEFEEGKQAKLVDIDTLEGESMQHSSSLVSSNLSVVSNQLISNDKCREQMKDLDI